MRWLASQCGVVRWPHLWQHAIKNSNVFFSTCIGWPGQRMPLQVKRGQTSVYKFHPPAGFP